MSGWQDGATPGTGQRVDLPGEGVVQALAALRREDRDRYLCTLASPARLRPDLVALYAFSAEIAGIADKVREPMPGLIRLQWWRDALAEIASGRQHRHHLVRCLADLIDRRHLTPDLAIGMIDARERDVDARQPADLVELEAYASATAGALAELSLECCMDRPGPVLRQAARDAGTAYGLVGIVRATGHLAARRRILLPADAMAAAGLLPGPLFEMKPGPALRPVTVQVCDRARTLLASARREQPPRAAVAAFLPGRLAGVQLEQLAAEGYDPLAPASLAPSGLTIWHLLASRWLGRI